MHVMSRSRIAAVAVIALATGGALAGGAARAATGASGAASGYAPPAGMSYACQQATGADATCGGLTVTDGTGSGAPILNPPAPPTGLDPSDIRTAYALPSTTAISGQTVAVVGAWNYANAAADLSAYRSAYGIAACTTANGCFKVVDVTSGTMPPSAGWDVSEAQSMDMISAVCPSCHILLVQAQTTGIADTDGLGAAENEAVALGATFIVDPWSVPEASVGSSETTYDTDYFDHPGVVITASGGDGGYTAAVSYPAASPDVVAVGGTTLTPASGSRGYTESAWGGTQSGCSAHEPEKPAWQADSACLGRSLNDVAAVADPTDSIVYFDSDYNSAGWGTGGGTDYAAAIIAAAYALDGPPAPGSNPASYLYDHPAALGDITTGSTGTCNNVPVLCNAGTGWDGPTGMGTPFGINAFHTVGAEPVAVTATGGTTWAFVTATDGTIQAASLPSGSSAWSALTSLGGSWPSYPAAIATSDGSVWVFAVDGSVAGGNLWADQLPNGSSTWSGWTEIGNPGVDVLGTPTVLQDNAGQIDLFARSAVNGNMWETTLPSGSTTWSAFTKLGGNLPNNVDGVVGSGGVIYLMGVGNNSELYYDELPAGGSWTGWTLIGGKVTGVPAIIADTGGNDHVFVRQISNGAILTSVLPNGAVPPWPALSSLGGSVLNDPVAWAGHGGTNFVFVIGTNSDMYYDKESFTTWSGLTDIGTGYTGVPGVVQDNDGNYHLMTRTTSGELAAFLLVPPPQPPPTLLGGSLAAS